MREIPIAAAQLLVVLVGIPGSGKSTFAKRVIDDIVAIPSVAKWQHVSQRTLKTRRKCMNSAKRALRAGDHVIIDRCNFDEAQRAHWMALPGADDTHRVAVLFDIPRSEAVGKLLCRFPQASEEQRKIRGIVSQMSRSLSPPTYSGIKLPHVFVHCNLYFDINMRGSMAPLDAYCVLNDNCQW